MSTSRRRRKDQELLNHLVGTPDIVPTAMGDIVNPVESLAIEPTKEDIARRAYQLYQARGGDHGHDWADWFQAERELRHRALRDVIDTIATTGGPYAAA